MIKEIKVPDIGEKVESMQVVGILINVGDFVEVDQGLIEVETNKAAVEIPSPESGKIVEVLVKENDELKIGQAVAKIDVDVTREKEANDSRGGKEKETGKSEATDKSKTKKKVDPDTESKPAAKKENKKGNAATDEPADQETDSDKADKETSGTKSKSETESRSRTSQASGKASGNVAAPASPSVRRLARELGVDINEIEGSGPDGRISDDDVKDFVRGQIKSSGFSLSASSSSVELPDFSKWGKVNIEPMSSLRTAVANSMSMAWQIVPQVTQFDEADITEMDKFRKKYGEHIKEAGGKLTVTAILLKVVTAALQRFPRFNASIDTVNKEIIYKKYINIAVAVDTDRGLVVPVIKNVDHKNIHELSVELTDIADRTRERKVKPEELEGGTFTVSNQGGIGGTNFTPIVYWPQVAILGVSRSRSHLEHMDGRTEPRIILPLALSYDHRIIDGADAARFLSWIVDALEHPLLLNLEN